MESITSIHFTRKPPSVHTLRKNEGKGDPEPFRVAKVIQLTGKEFEHFMFHLLDDAPYIADNSDLSGRDPRGWAIPRACRGEPLAPYAACGRK